MSRAQPAAARSTPASTTWSRACASPAACPSPRLYVIDDPAPNAFATGRNPKHAAIAVTTGLLEKMNRVELEGVLAHELSPHQELRHPRVDPGRHDGGRRRAARRHRHPDAVVGRAATRTATTTSTAATAARWRSWRSSASSCWLLAPIVATGHAAAVSRRRETLADVSGVEMTRYPPGLISALEKLRDDKTVVARAPPGHGPPLDRAAGGADARTRAGCRGSTGCSTPTRRSRSASPCSASCDVAAGRDRPRLRPLNRLTGKWPGTCEGCRP